MRHRMFPPALLAVLAVLLTGCGGSAAHHHAHPVRHRAASSALYGGRPRSPGFVASAQHPVGISHPKLHTAIPQLAGYDAVTASAIPFGAPVALCYADGRYANCTAVAARHPVHLVTIAVNTAGVARLLDDEPGDATPAQAGPWVRSMIFAHHIWRPGVYADAANMPGVKASLAAAGLKRPQYTLMLADWDGSPQVPAGYDAKQWRSTQALDFDSFAASFLSAPTPPSRTVCFGKHQANTSTCRHARADVAGWTGEDNHVHRVWIGLGQQARELRCHRPYRRTSCQTFGQIGPDLGRAASRLHGLIAAAEHKYG